MKKSIILTSFFLAYAMSLTAQVTREQADSIVLERMSSETRAYTLYANEALQEEGYTINTSAGEVFELDYSCCVYFVRYTNEVNVKYLIVKESTGNLLEFNAQNDEGPENLEDWIIIISYPIEISFTEYSLAGTSCRWIQSNDSAIIIIINSNEELEEYMICTNGSYPEIDFSEYTLLLARGIKEYLIFHDNTILQQFPNRYVMTINLRPHLNAVMTYWHVPIIVRKIADDTTVELIITEF